MGKVEEARNYLLIALQFDPWNAKIRREWGEVKRICKLMRNMDSVEAFVCDETNVFDPSSIGTKTMVNNPSNSYYDGDGVTRVLGCK